MSREDMAEESSNPRVAELTKVANPHKVPKYTKSALSHNEIKAKTSDMKSLSQLKKVT